MIEQAIKSRQPIPQAIQDAPALLPGLQFFFDSFVSLNTCRSVGMEEGWIPWTAVNDYSVRYGLDDMELDTLWALIHSMDTAYLDFSRKKSKSTIGEKPKQVQVPPEKVVGKRSPRR